jgi:hypothetical protein
VGMRKLQDFEREIPHAGRCQSGTILGRQEREHTIYFVM